ncbi:hypothetical protein BDW22DRAFT_325633 [Trametopsis cervina]|nr:hypothetical protein BDW22DRAFT_325633 [Trametopsis cervina]
MWTSAWYCILAMSKACSLPPYSPWPRLHYITLRYRYSVRPCENAYAGLLPQGFVTLGCMILFGVEQTPSVPRARSQCVGFGSGRCASRLCRTKSCTRETTTSRRCRPCTFRAGEIYVSSRACCRWHRRCRRLRENGVVATTTTSRRVQPWASVSALTGDSGGKCVVVTIPVVVLISVNSTLAVLI